MDKPDVTTDTSGPSAWVPLQQATRFASLGPDDPPPHPNTLKRWAREGIDGVRLAVRIRGTRWFTTESAVRQFLAAVEARRLAPA
jgi:Protein of unknown function (DUF1580)